MKKKVRDRLDRIEQALKELIKAVGKLDPLPHQLTTGERDDASPALRPPKAIEKIGQEALRKKRRRTPK